MPPRTRSRQHIGIARYTKDGSTWERRSVATDSITDQVPGPGPCTHIKPFLANGLGFRNAYSPQTEEFSNYHIVIPPAVENAAVLALNKVYGHLDWSKLPSSSKFSLIGIIAEIDETLAMFSRKFLASLSYGSITWGILPFVSEVCAVAKAVENLAMSISSFSYESSQSSPFEVFLSNYRIGDLSFDTTFRGKAFVRHTGSCDITINNPADLALDWIGLHPDLATAWDLLPLSFVVDYLFPIGSYLESFRNGGWVSKALFQGWVTFGYEVDTIIRRRSSISYPQPDWTIPGRPYSKFWRRSATVLLETAQEVEPWDGPSLIQLFNIFYLALARR